MRELYRWLPLQKIPAAGIGIAVWSRGACQHLVVTPAIAGVLCEHDTFRTVEDLIADAQSKAWANSEICESISQTFHEAIRCGLLIPLSRVKSAVADTPDKSSHPLATLIVPTAGRPALVRRCVASFVHDASLSGRRIQVVVSDNSGNPDSERNCRAELEQVAQLNDVKVTFVGAIEARAIREEILRQTNVPIETLNFLLSGIPGKPNIGANRNLLLVLASGRRVLSADSDMICEPRRFRDANSTTREFCGPTISAVEYRAAPDGRSLEEQTVRSSRFLWDSHDEVLGRRCATMLRDCLQSDLLTISGDAVKSVIRGVGTIRASYSGIYGDPGIHCRPSLAFMFNQTPNSLRPAGVCDEALTTGDMVIAAKSTLISRGGPWPGGCFGIDLSEVGPPFMPCYQGEDWLFGLLLSSRPDSYVAHLAEAVLHRPSCVRVTVNYDAAISIRMADIMRGLCMSTAAAKSSLSTRDWLYQMGTELSQASDDDLNQWLHGVSWSYYRSLMTTLERISMDTDTPDSVIEATDHLRRAVDRAIRRADFIVPFELRGQSANGTTEEALNDTYSFINLFGRGLRQWPAIVAAAEGLVERAAGYGQLRPKCSYAGHEG
jgi:hypothetical protein